MISKGATPTHIFEVNIDLTNAKSIYISYKQRNVVVIEKTIEDIDVSESELRVDLSQEETLRLNSCLPVNIQIRATYADNSAVVSNIMVTYVQDVLKKESI